MNDTPIKIPAPVDSSSDSMNIHLSYIRRDLDELKTIQKTQHVENLEAMNRLQSAIPTREEFNALKTESLDHETRIRKVEWMMWVGVGGLYVFNAILGIWLAYRK